MELKEKKDSAQIVATKSKKLNKKIDPYNYHNPSEIEVKVKYMPGSLFYILWVNCPHKDNIIESHIQAKATALVRVKRYQWTLVSDVKKKKDSAQIVATNEETIKSDELDSVDIPVKFIGQFGYNENGVLVEGVINTCEISINKGQVYCSAEVGQTPFGWAFGTNYGSKFTHTGSGGSMFGVFIDSRYQYSTKEDAATASLYDLKREFESELKNAPKAAATQFKKIIEVLEAQIGGAPEPKDFDILAKPEIQKPNKIKKQKDKLTTCGGPRTELIKFRCSSQTKELVSEMAKLTDLSVSDLIHKAIQVFPKYSYRLNTIDQERLNEII